ncbi:MAG: hypothetical protein J5887_06855 [Erysipelotrichaceae bacterium]|nr:hypothetical protein [Erysipelotrichaceae bacterium]
MSEEKTVKLENEYVEATVSEKAAEVISFKRKDNGIEMIWCRDPAYWYNCNPILFPYYSKLKDGRYEIDGRTIEMGQHGFARRAWFRFTRVERERCELELSDDEDTWALYPFHFTLKVRYQLEGCRIVISYQIINRDRRDLPFNIGFHPAFNCPFTPDRKYEDYRIEFEKCEDLRHPEKPHLTSGSSFSLCDTLVDGSYFYENSQIKSNWCQLTDGVHTLRVGIEGYQILGFWKKSTDTPFICIEPWRPVCDLRQARTFRDDVDNNLLPPNQQFECSYYFEIVS